MSFCKECGSIIQKYMRQDYTIEFQCDCQCVQQGTPDDTLLYEKIINNEQTIANNFYDVLMENAAYDPAANFVKFNCRNCTRDYMTLVRVAGNETVYYTCSCGYKISYLDYHS